MTRFTLGTNLCFATNRWPEPEEWARLVSQDLGLRSVQLVSDLLNPLWPQSALDVQTGRVIAAVSKYGIRIHSLMTGGFTRLNLLMYPHQELREVWFDWYRRFVDLAATLGAEAIGSHLGALSVRDVSDPGLYRTRVDDAIRMWQELSFYAQARGLKYLYFETMSIPREMGYTIQEARTLLDRVNERVGVPVKLCLDVGHAPHPEQRDPYPWLESLGAEAPIVHLQQTELGYSRHWPFTLEYNAKGIVEPRRVLDTLAATGIAEVWLGFEVLHRERWEEEQRVLPDLVASAEYWRQFVPQDGLEWA
jgi:sugar phosphate isomerase/epimerase